MVSVIVPNYNHQAFLMQRLQSILNQTYEHFEVILLDDHSTDDSIQILQTFKNHKKVSHVIINSENSGSPFKQWQKGFTLAKGAYIWIAESDDYCEPTFLETTVTLLQSRADVCYVQSNDVDSSGQVISNRIKFTEDFTPNIWEHDFILNGREFIQKYLLTKNVIPNASAVVFKKSLLSASVVDNDLLQMRMCGDWLFWIRLLTNAHIAFSKKTLNSFRIHGGVTRNHHQIETKKKRIIEEQKVRKYLYNNFGLSRAESEERNRKKWFKMHTAFSIFGEQFYQGRGPSTSKWKFLIQFFKNRLRKMLG